MSPDRQPNSKLRVLWICGLPHQVEQDVLGGVNHGAYAAWSWVMGHLPPPDDVELHIACRTHRSTAAKSFTYKGAHFHLVPVRSRARVLCLFEFDSRFYRKLFRELAPDVVHGWGTEDGYAVTAVKLAPERCLIQVQGCINAYLQRVPLHWMMRLVAWSERRVLRRARHVVAENEYALQSALPWVTTRSTHVVEHPIREEFLTAKPSSGDGKRVVFVGALSERKGIGDALSAFAAGAPPDWQLVLIGDGPPEMTAQVQARAKERDLAGRVTHHARLDALQIVAELQQASVFLLPTRIDTGPTSLKEAMAMGLWPICYDNSGPAHYIRHFGFGAAAKDLDVDALTQALRTAISARTWQEPMQREKIENAIRPLFRRERIWGDLKQVYGLVGSSRRP